MEIPYQDRAALCQLCKLTEDSPLSEALEVQYWRARRLVNRLGGCPVLPVEILINVALNAGMGYEMEGDTQPVTFAELVSRGEVQANDKIKITWRKQEREVIFQGIGPDGKVSVYFEDDGLQRKVAPKDILLPQAA